ncbi:organic solvent ABC transporter permease [Marinobacter sp. CHS3-4]|uniref:organic solvent ABC transporter permease n=1 Tax=Marinobacter sp. CHS3-4 TaxID=3045174 RepID=UPI0024B60433|nr:organic solvent ABC transporter permease [Marinobacter sp. CHS3-4]MDI9245197.1 organic solvent ABC transporter permease [Marinobacter sp. CHS3-4]
MSALLLAGCLDDDKNGGSNGAEVGQITPTGISGLTYQTASQRGKTNEKGEYEYYPGEELTLWVGDLQLISGVPVEPVVTPLEFFTDEREALKIAGTTEEGLQSHRITEQQLVQTSDPLINLTRFLLTLNWRMRTADGQGIEIRERVIEQLNATLPSLTDPIDFNVPRGEFALDDDDRLSPANQLLAEICFYPPDNELCQEPPTQEAIDNAPPRPEDPEDRDEDVEYKEDKENLRDRILKSIRTIADIEITTAENFLTRELDIISTDLAIEYYLDEFVADFPQSDTAIKSIDIKKIGGEPSLANLEAISTRDQDVVVHSFSWQTASVEYFLDGEAGGEAEILVNFKPDDTYRWIKKSLRVVITP